MATQNQVQGVFGEFKPVLDPATTITQDNVQGVFGEFKPVLDPAAGDEEGGTTLVLKDIIGGSNVIPFLR